MQAACPAEISGGVQAKLTLSSGQDEALENYPHTPLNQCLFSNIEWRRYLGEAYQSQYSMGVLCFV